MYEYLWGHTIAQIELMTYDQPFVAYKRTREETMTEKRERMNESVEKWKKRKEARKKRGFNLQHFLRTGEKIENNKTEIL